VRSDRERLHDIVEASEALERLVAPRLDELSEDEVLALAAERLVEMIGEAAANVSGELRGRYPEVDWRGPANIRVVLAHRYFGIDRDIVRRAIEDDVPRLREQVCAILEELA
jgi:uncharacterized protein with HEPN domain